MARTLVLTDAGEWIDDQSAPIPDAPQNAPGRPERPAQAQPRTLADYNREQAQMRRDRAAKGGRARVARDGSAAMRAQALKQAQEMTAEERAARSAKGWQTRRARSAQ